MDMQEFTLHDGTIAVQVKGDGRSISLNFDITDVDHAKPVIDIVKFNHASATCDTIRKAWEIIAAAPIPEATLGKNDSHLYLAARFQEAGQYESALTAVRGSIRPPFEQGRISAPPPLPRPGRQEFIAPPLEIVPEPSGDESLSQRLKSAEGEAGSRSTARRWVLENQLEGIVANVFPINESVFTGIASEHGKEEKKLIAVRILPGKKTVDARTEITRLTNEVEKMLISRGLDIKMARVYLGGREDGSRDSGIILVRADNNPLQVIEKVNAALEYVQDHLDVLKAKLGRGRGEDHRQRRTIPAEPDALELTLLGNVRSAIKDGLLTLNGDDTALRNWVNTTAEKMRAQRDQDNPERGARTA